MLSLVVALLVLPGRAGVWGSIGCSAVALVASASPWRPSGDAVWSETLNDNEGAGHLAAIDMGHLPMASRTGWNHDGLGGLVSHLHRAGMRPILPDGPLEGWIDAVDLLVMPTPLIDLDPESFEALEGWVEKGGEVLLTARPDSVDGGSRVKQHLGITIADLPLGPAEVDALGGRAKFRCAYSIDSMPAEALTLGEAYGAACMVWIPRGEGGWLVLSDDRFLLNDNLEGQELYVPETSDFVLRALAFLDDRTVAPNPKN